jgi:ribosomal protein L7/L12
MPRPKRAEPPILAMLEKAFAKYRKKVKPRFPYDAQTNVIHLPDDIEAELRHLVLAGQGVEAVKRVTELTGAGLRVSKDYVDSLVPQRERRKGQYRPDSTG